MGVAITIKKFGLSSLPGLSVAVHLVQNGLSTSPVALNAQAQMASLLGQPGGQQGFGQLYNQV